MVHPMPNVLFTLHVTKYDAWYININMTLYAFASNIVCY